MNFKFFLKKSIATAIDALFPPVCLLCAAALTPTERRLHCCARCMASIPVATAFSCADCGARLPLLRALCHPHAPYVLAAATQFSDARVQQLIYALKYDKIRAAAAPLAELLITHLRAVPLDLSHAVLLPVPLHYERERARGFNQAELIARVVGSTFHVPVVTNILQRIRHTEPQASNKKCSRETNVLGCFATVRSDALRGRRVILVDDVTTSGATLREATHALRAIGARNIVALVVARAR